MKKFIVGVIVVLAILYFWFQYKKKKAIQDAKPQSSTTSLPANTDVRGDIVTPSDTILATGISVPANSNDGILPSKPASIPTTSTAISSATADNPVTSSNPNPVSLSELGSVTVTSVAKVPVAQPITVTSPAGVIPDNIVLTDGRSLASFSPGTSDTVKIQQINSILSSTPSLLPLIPSNLKQYFTS